MSDFLKSAFDYFGSSGKTRNGNELVGNCIEIGNQNFRILNTIAEGGFSVVLLGQEVKTNKCFAVKRLLSQDSDTNNEIMQEINILKKLSNHPNIIKLITAASIGQEKHRHVGMEFLIVTEFCTGGQIIQLMQRRNKSFPYNVTLQIFNHIAKAIEHMHSQDPPIIHRDLKVENLLISERAVIKLCDFGSSTTIKHEPSSSWTGLRRSEVQEEIEKHTTPMYRSPEMLDLYQNFPIDEACDIWALGCVLYYLCCNKHPFEDSAKLAILNAKYALPSTLISVKEFNDSLCGLIFQMLLIDPRQRPKISDIVNEVRVQASASNVALKPSIIFDKESLHHLPPLSIISDQTESPKANINKPQNVPPSRPNAPAPKRPMPINQPSTPVRTSIHSVQPTKSHIATNAPGIVTSPDNNDGKKVLGFLKEGAGQFMKNIRDASNKVMEQVSATINKTDLDITYVTSRIIMMPTPGEVGIDTITRDRIDDVQAFLEFRHPDQYYIYNLSLRQIKPDKFKDHVYQELTFDPFKCPQLKDLIKMMLHQVDWLAVSQRHIIVIQCNDGRSASALCVAALMCFCRVVETSKSAMDIIKFRRGDCAVTPSQLRYIDYVCRIMRRTNESPTSNIPHNHLVKLSGLVLEPVPIFNRSRTGVRPLVEIFCDYKLVYSNIKNYDDLTVYTEEHKTARIPIPNISLYGDVNIVLYHTRSNIVAKGKLSTLKICETQIHTGYLSKNCTEVILTKKELDHLDSDGEKYPQGFTLQIHLIVTNKEAVQNDQTNSSEQFIWHNNDFRNHLNSVDTRDDRLLLFGSRDEMRVCVVSADVKIPPRNSFKSKVSPTHETKAEPDDFFTTLSWSNNEDNESEETKNRDKHSQPIEGDLISGDFIANGDCNNGDYDTIGPYNNDVDDGDAMETTIEKEDTEHNNANIGDLLGDLTGGSSGVREPVNKVETTSNNKESEEFLDFFSAFPDKTHNFPEDGNLLGGGTGQNIKANAGNNASLLMFDTTTTSSTTNAINTTTTMPNDKLFDPFGGNLFPSNSISNISTNGTSHVVDNHSNWTADLLFNQPNIGGTTNSHAAPIKPSNSTNSLINLINTPGATASSQVGVPNTPQIHYNLSPAHAHHHQNHPSTVKPSSSFTSPQQHHHNSDIDIFDSLSNTFQSTSIAANAKPATKPKPAVKPVINQSTPANPEPANKKPRDAFKDLLGDFKPASESSGGSGKTIKDMRKIEMAKTKDPEALLILDWIEGRERNIRALLCSLSLVLWEGVRWGGVNIAELVTVDQVKRAYKNAIRCVHPDKWNNSEFENRAKLIMIELNDAMTEFEAERNAAS